MADGIFACEAGGGGWREVEGEVDGEGEGEGDGELEEVR